MYIGGGVGDSRTICPKENVKKEVLILHRGLTPLFFLLFPFKDEGLCFLCGQKACG